MQIICFEDDRVEQLRPIILARPAYAISCASFRLIDWLRRHSDNLSGYVRPYLQELQRLDYQIAAPPKQFDGPDGVLLVNARLAPTVAIDSVLKRMSDESVSSAVTDAEDGSLLIARMTASDILDLRIQSIDALLAAAAALRPAPVKLDVFRWPHDVIAHHMLAIKDAMEWRIVHEDHIQLTDGVFVKSPESIGDYVSVDVSAGPILLDEQVRIGPFTHLSGPIHAGAHTRIAEHAAIKDGVSLGHTVKLGGEVEASIIEPYSNKQHHGFLGHSYLGSWINLGAGTCNSDLKNTYGKINVQYGENTLASGMQFLGCIMGDYSKIGHQHRYLYGKSNRGL